IIHYFHPVEVYKSLPRILFLMLETCAVIRSCLDEESYEDLRRHPDVRTLSANAQHILGSLVRALHLDRQARHHVEGPFEEARRWEQRHRQTLDQLRAAGIRTRTDYDAGWDEYRAQREVWETMLYRFAAHLGYDWDEITGDHDLRSAVEEELVKPQVSD
ncbi:MAG: hypothetical protein ACRD9R_19980, partial [Pyrinomonadaceae bacterium]